MVVQTIAVTDDGTNGVSQRALVEVLERIAVAVEALVELLQPRSRRWPPADDQ
jgi:hypothetical protein